MDYPLIPFESFLQVCSGMFCSHGLKSVAFGAAERSKHLDHRVNQRHLILIHSHSRLVSNTTNTRLRSCTLDTPAVSPHGTVHWLLVLRALCVFPLDLVRWISTIPRFKLPVLSVFCKIKEKFLLRKEIFLSLLSTLFWQLFIIQRMVERLVFTSKQI